MGDTEGQPAVISPLDDAQPDPVLARLDALAAQNVQLIEATKTAQGQARRAEQQAQMAWDAAQSLRSNVAKEESPTDAISALVRQLNDAQPAEKLIKDALLAQQATIKSMMGEVQTLKGHKQRQELDDAQRSIREQTVDQLIEYATDMGVDITTIKDSIGKLETGPNGAIVWTEGKKIIREAKKGRAADNEQSAEPVYTESRGATGSRPRSKVEMEQAYADGNITTEAYAAWKRSH